MKRSLIRLLILILYIFILITFEKWDLKILFAPKLLLYFALGVSLFALFQYRQSSVTDAFLPVGVIGSFLLILYTKDSSDFWLNLRPLFYSFLLMCAFNSKKGFNTGAYTDVENTEDSSSSFQSTLYFLLKEKGVTEREIEITFLILKGLSNYAIAEELYITESTVKKHISHIYEKLSVHNRKQLLEYCQTLGQNI